VPCPKCSKPSGKFKYCDACLLYWNKRRVKRRAQPKPAGICSRPDCKRKAKPGLRMCSHCIQICAKQASRYRPKKNDRNHELKLEVFAHYGSECACCGENLVDFLSIDHIGGYDGSSPRKGAFLYRWLKRNAYPAGFRLLCMNCNFAIGHFGSCPHQLLARKVA
jgi:hypothetical protein